MAFAFGPLHVGRIGGQVQAIGPQGQDVIRSLIERDTFDMIVTWQGMQKHMWSEEARGT